MPLLFDKEQIKQEYMEYEHPPVAQVRQTWECDEYGIYRNGGCDRSNKSYVIKK